MAAVALPCLRRDVDVEAGVGGVVVSASSTFFRLARVRGGGSSVIGGDSITGSPPEALRFRGRVGAAGGGFG